MISKQEGGFSKNLKILMSFLKSTKLMFQALSKQKRHYLLKFGENRRLV